MATDKKQRRTVFNKDKINAIEKITSGRLYGIDQDFLNQIDDERDKIKDVINKTNMRHNQIVGNGIIEFITSMIYEENISANKNKRDVNNASNSQHFENILNSSNITELTNIFNNEKERVILYDEYESIVNFIPQVYQALDAMTDAILSPDDFSKKILNFLYDGSEDPTLDDQRRVLSNLEHLERVYKIEDKLKNVIFKSLYLGDSFVLVSSLKKEFNKILTEETSFFNESTVLSESNFNLNKDELNAVRELLLIEGESSEKETQDDKKKDKDISDKELERILTNIVNKNVEFSNNSSSLIEKELKVAKEFNNTSSNEENIEKYINKTIKNNDAGSSSSLLLTPEGIQKIIDKTIKDNTDSSSSPILTNVTDEEKNKYRTYSVQNLNKMTNKNSKDTDIKGSYIKILDPRRIVKLKMGSTCFGYFYIETNLPERSKDSLVASTSGRSNDLRLRNNVDISANNIEEELNNPKIKLITDVFGRALSTKVNKKFVEDNREFKVLIYELLKNDYITNKRVRIVFLGPDEVFHFRAEEDEDGYGISKLEKVLFTCKLYIATLITNLMMKLSRSSDHRAFYVDTGLSNDVEGTIQSFIRDIKTKEIRLSDLKTVDTIFRSIGQLNIADVKVF